MIKFYRLNFDKGVPVIGGSMRWRTATKTIPAYCLGDAFDRITTAARKQYGQGVQINFLGGVMSKDKAQWEGINPDLFKIRSLVMAHTENTKQTNI